MNNKSIGLTILWFVEAIVAIRVLLFAVPVIISKIQDSHFMVTQVADRFIVVATATALTYLVVGVSSVMGYRYWKALHFLAAVFTLVLTVGSLSFMGQPSGQVTPMYFSPIVVAVVIVVFAGTLGHEEKTS